MTDFTTGRTLAEATKFTNIHPILVSEVFDWGNNAQLVFTATDNIQAITIPAGTFVLEAGYEVLELETGNATATLMLGDDNQNNRYAAVGTINDAAELGYSASTGTARFYDVEDTIDIQTGVAAFTNAVVRVWALVIPSTQLTATTQTETFTVI